MVELRENKNGNKKIFSFLCYSQVQSCSTYGDDPLTMCLGNGRKNLVASGTKWITGLLE